MGKRVRDSGIRIAECLVSESRFRNCRFPQQFTHCGDIEAHPEPGDEQIPGQTQLVHILSETPLYRQRVGIVPSVRGTGLIAGMELVMEL